MVKQVLEIEVPDGWDNLWTSSINYCNRACS